MDKNFFLKQLDEILKDYSVLEADTYNKPSYTQQIALLTRAKAVITRLTGNKSEYYKDAEKASQRSTAEHRLMEIIGVVNGLKSDLENGYLKSLGEIIQAEVFSNYLEMATHLLEQGYKDPAAVLIGSTLEAHLRKLCVSNAIDIETTNGRGDKIPKKANTLNDELARASVLTVSQQKQVTAWLDLRNKAAHGEYEKYTKEEILLMLQGVNLLMTFK